MKREKIKNWVEPVDIALLKKPYVQIDAFYFYIHLAATVKSNFPFRLESIQGGTIEEVIPTDLPVFRIRVGIRVPNVNSNTCVINVSIKPSKDDQLADKSCMETGKLQDSGPVS